MSDDEEDDEPVGWADWIENALGFWIAVAVISASIIVPLTLWAATKFFGWEPPEFIADWIDFFAA